MSDLGRRRISAQRRLSDRCRITRDVEGYGDDTLNPTTLALEAPELDEALVFDGPCSISGEVGRSEIRGGAEIHVDAWLVRVPADAVRIAKGDRVEVMDCDADADLVGRSFTVVRSLGGSRTVLRRLIAEEKSRGPAR